MDRLGQTLDQPSVALVAGQVVALWVTARQQGFQVIEHQQTAARLQARHELRDTLLQRGGEICGRRLGEEGDTVGDQLLAGGGVTYRAPEHRLKLGSQAAPQEGGQHTLADAAHTQEHYQAAALLHDPVGQFGHFHLATGEVAHVEGSHPVNARKGCGLLSSLGNQGLGLREKLDGRSRSDQVVEPGFIQQYLLVRRTPERADLLFLVPGGKGRGSHPQGNELFEAFSFGVAEACLPLCHRAPGNAKPVGQSGLC